MTHCSALKYAKRTCFKTGCLLIAVFTLSDQHMLTYTVPPFFYFFHFSRHIICCQSRFCFEHDKHMNNYGIPFNRYILFFNFTHLMPSHSLHHLCIMKFPFKKFIRLNQRISKTKSKYQHKWHIYKQAAHILHIIHSIHTCNTLSHCINGMCKRKKRI